jgi:phage shock protein C
MKDGSKQKKLYRARNGWLLGVCKGLSEWCGVKPAWFRLAWLILFFITGWFPATIAYVVVGLILKPKPVVKISNEHEQEFYDSYLNSSQQALRRLKDRFDRLDRKTQNIETLVTSREFDWEVDNKQRKQV